MILVRHLIESGQMAKSLKIDDFQEDFNKKLEESPELVNESPYDFGWMVIMEPQGKISGLLDAKSYRESID